MLSRAVERTGRLAPTTPGPVLLVGRDHAFRHLVASTLRAGGHPVVDTSPSLAMAGACEPAGPGPTDVVVADTGEGGRARWSRLSGTRGWTLPVLFVTQGASLDRHREARRRCAWALFDEEGLGRSFWSIGLDIEPLASVPGVAARVARALEILEGGPSGLAASIVGEAGCEETAPTDGDLVLERLGHGWGRSERFRVDRLPALDIPFEVRGEQCHEPGWPGLRLIEVVRRRGSGAGFLLVSAFGDYAAHGARHLGVSVLFVATSRIGGCTVHAFDMHWVGGSADPAVQPARRRAGEARG
jgi:hypothetical protein